MGSLNGLTIAGSDLLGAGVAEAIKGELGQRGVDSSIQFNGSLSAREDYRNGTADACIIAVPDGTEPGIDGMVYQAAFQAVAFAVHSTNPLSDLNYAQLTELFQDGGNLDGWASLLEDIAWQDRKISFWASRSDKAITLEIFNAVVLDGKPLKRSLGYKPANVEQLLRTVEEDASTLLITPVIETSASVRLLPIKRSANEQAYTPSSDNVFYGDYPLRLPFVLVVKESVDAGTRAKLVQAIYSDSVHRAMVSAFYVPIPESEQQAVLSELK